MSSAPAASERRLSVLSGQGLEEAALLRVGAMPVFVAYFKAELDGVKYAGVYTGKDRIFEIDVKNGMSDEVREKVTISSADEYELEGSRGISNLVLKFASQ